MNMDSYQEALDSYSISDSTTEKIFQNMVESKEPAHRAARTNIKKCMISAAVGCAAIACAFIGGHFLNSPTPEVITPSPIDTTSHSTEQATLPPHTESNSPSTTNQISRKTESPKPESSTNPVSTPETQPPTSPIVSVDGVIWNRVKPGPSSMMYKDPDATAQYFDLAKFIDYVGYDPFPKQLPEGYELQGTYGKELYFNPDGSPTDYYCGFGLTYYNGEKSITVSAGKAKLNAHSSVAIYDDSQQKLSLSKVKEHDVLLKVFTPPILSYNVTRSAEFQIDGLNYYVYATNDVSPEDFLEVIASLV